MELRLAAPPTGPKPQTQCHVIQSQGAPARLRDSSPGRLDLPPSTEPLARLAARSPSAGPAGCAFSKHKAAGECPNPKAAESSACVPASQAQAARSAGCALKAQSSLRASQTQSCWITLLLVHQPKPKRLEPLPECPTNKAAGLADQRPDCLPGTTPTTPT